MHTPESIKSALNRLMPPALSETGRASIESMLDDLAAGALIPQRKRGIPPRLTVVAGITGMAAAVTLLAAGAFKPAISTPAFAVGPSDAAIASTATPGMVLIGESEQVEDICDDGMLATPDGDAVQAVRSRVVGASRFLDEETGIEVTVSQPREEVVLIPVSNF